MTRLLLFLLLAAAFLVNASSEPVQSGHVPEKADTAVEGSMVQGTVTLPAATTVQRNFRGRSYGNRGGKSVSSNQEQNNPMQNTIISLHPLSYELQAEPLGEPAVINQKDATFIPHVTPVIIGSIVEFVNDDSFYHNVFSLTPGAKFNIGRRPTGDVYSKEIPRTQWVVEGLGEIQLFCDIHSQMNAVILSLDTPYFIRVNDDGTFKINDLPAGTYELRGYNPQFDVATREITLDGENTVEINLNFLN